MLMRKLHQAESIQKEQSSCVALCLRSSHQAKAKGLGKSGRETVDRDLKRWGSRRASIANETLIPTETPMRPLCSGQHLLFLDVLFLLSLSRARGKDDGLRAYHTEPPTPYLTAFPISPEYRTRSWRGKRLNWCRWRLSQCRWRLHRNR